MTSARRAAIRKAQLASARKRRGRKRRKTAARVGAGIAGVAGLGVVAVTVRASYRRKKTRSARSVTSVPSVTVNSSPTAGPIPGTNTGWEGIDLEGEVTKLTGKEVKLNKHRHGKGKIIVGSDGVARKVKRNRDNRNEKERNNYSPGKRHERYLRDKAAGRIKKKKKK